MMRPRLHTRRCWIQLVVFFALINVSSLAEPKSFANDAEQHLKLGIRAEQFTLNGQPTFLLGISYYGGLGADAAIVTRDLDAMKRCGFNWIRVWATWESFGENISAVDAQGNDRLPYMDRLLALVRMADQQGIVVDVTLTRGKLLPTFQAHRAAVRLLAERLKPYRNVYIDPANEHGVGDDRHVSVEEMAGLCNAIKSVDPDRLLTTSGLGLPDTQALAQLVGKTRVDFISPHLGRDPQSPGATAEVVEQYRRILRDTGRVMPVHLQEPFRRGYDPAHWEPKAKDFALDLEMAKAGGAAGWCFHNGTQKNAPEGQPRRSFDLRRKSLFDQLDPEENQFLSSLKK
jgi:hypothetical protein